MLLKGYLIFRIYYAEATLAEHGNRNNCSKAKPTAHTGSGITVKFANKKLLTKKLILKIELRFHKF
jgi:hypothetical protein